MHRLFSGSELSAFETIINAAPAMLWLSLPDGECVYLSPSWYLFTGLGAPSGLAQGWQEPIHPEDREKVSSAYREAAAAGATYQVEYRLLAADGTYRWVLDSAAPFAGGAEHTFGGYAGSIIEIEARKQAELQRDLAAFRAKLSVEASEIGLWEWNLETNLFMFSSKARQIFGLDDSAAPLTFEQMQSAIHPDDIDQVRRKSVAALDPDIRASEAYDYRVVRPDGSTRWVHARGEAVFEAGPKLRPVRYIGTFRDVTDAVLQQRQLTDTADRLQMAIDASGLAIWELDLASGEVVPSVQLNRLFGFADDARPSLGDFHARYAPGELERVTRLGEQAAARGEREIRLEVRHLWPDASEHWLLIQAKQDTAQDGRERIIGVAMDITATKQHERQLEVVAHELQHRVKNSLSIVQILARQTFRPGRDTREANKAFEQRLQSLARTTNLLTRDLGASASLCEIVDGSLESFRDQSTDQFVVEGGPVQLPPKLSVALGMALHELATNAIKYGALSASGKVHVHWHLEGSMLHFVWEEKGGPAVSAPTSTGFGTRLLGGSLFTPEEGSVSLDFVPTGLVCRLEINLSALKEASVAHE